LGEAEAAIVHRLRIRDKIYDGLDLSKKYLMDSVYFNCKHDEITFKDMKWSARYAGIIILFLLGSVLALI